MTESVINNKILCKFAVAMSEETLNIDEVQHGRGIGFKTCAWVGAVVAIAAWVSMVFSGNVSFCLAIIGVVVSAFGARAPKGLVRDMAITAIVASAVLIVVFAIFFGVIYYLERTLV